MIRWIGSIALCLCAANACAACRTQTTLAGVIEDGEKWGDGDLGGRFEDCYRPFLSGRQGLFDNATPLQKEAFLYDYVAAALAAVPSANPGDVPIYYEWARDAAEQYLEFSVIELGRSRLAISPRRVRDVLYYLGKTYDELSKLNRVQISKLSLEYATFCAQVKGRSADYFDRRAVVQWEKALRCYEGKSDLSNEEIKNRIRSDRTSALAQGWRDFVAFLDVAVVSQHLASFRDDDRIYLTFFAG